MGLVTGALQIGKNAILSYQSALQVVGNNIANAGVDGYTRQSPILTSMPGVTLPEGLMPGGGVALTSLQRHLDEALLTRLRASVGDEQKNLAEQQALSQVESLYNELSDEDLSSLLSNFFNSFDGVQNSPGPEGMSTREIAIHAGQSVATRLHEMRSGLLNLHEQLNQQIIDVTRQANDLAKQVAGLNLEIVRAESTGQGAAASLRDQRDGVLKQLAQFMDIQTSETPEGAVNVYVGSEPLVQYTRSRGLTAEQELVGDRTVVSVRFADSNGPVKIGSGQIAGLVSSRDESVYGQVQEIDKLAATLIEQVNRIHSQGQGLTTLTAITGAYDVLDTTAALSSAGSTGLPLAVSNGSFKLTVKDSNGVAQEYVIAASEAGLGTDMSLQDLVGQINSTAANVTASITSDNRLRLQAAGGYSFTFGEDTSGAMAALGMNAFFTGTDAKNIAVESGLAGDSGRLAAAKTGRAGDGSNAAALASLGDKKMGQSGASIPQLWAAAVSSLGAASSAARHNSEATHSVSQSLQAQRESISGVNTDEEAVNLLRYQRSFQAAARYISIVDQLVDEMLGMVR